MVYGKLPAHTLSHCQQLHYYFSETFDKVPDNDDIGEETPMIQEGNNPVEEEPTVHCHCGVNEVCTYESLV